MISLLFSFFLFANIESHLDMIEKAKRLTLQREREKALQILNLSLENKELANDKRKEIILAMDRIGEIFLQDRTQRLYSKAKSQAIENAVLALETLKEAQALEPYNIAIYLERAKIELGDKDCSNENQTAKEALDIHPYHLRLQSIYLQSLVCMEEDLEKDLKIGSIKGETPIYLGALDTYLKKDYRSALKQIEKGLKQKSHSANYYWLKNKVLAKQNLSTKDNEDLWRQACKENEKPKNSLYFNVCEENQIPWSLE